MSKVSNHTFNKKENKPVFDSDNFDRKVGYTTALLETNRLRYIENTKYNLWVNNNLDQLDYMHSLSNLDIDFNSFCNYIFNNSKN